MRKLTTAIVALAALALGLHPTAPVAAEPTGLARPAEPTTTAQAVGDPFDSVQFNICSLACSDGSPPAGGANTDEGLIPVDELLDVIAVRGWPRIISLNEVCGQAAFVMAANLPAGLYDASYYVSARRPPNCDLFGNWVAVRTGDVPATEASEFHFFWDGGTPPPGDTDSENRGGPCLRSFIFLEQTWGCSVHIDDDAAKSNGLLSDVNDWFGTTAQVMLGDFNFEPDESPMQAWANDNRADLFDDIDVTIEGDPRHIDYGWVELTVLNDDPDPLTPGSFSFLSASDHRQLWGIAAFRL